MNLEKEIKNQADAIFRKAHDKGTPFAERGYRIVSEIPDNSILFIGLNPSYPKEQENYIGSDFYNLNQDASGYFGKFKEIAKACNNSQWSHFDLLSVRETKQSNVENLERSNLEFICDQLFELSKPVLQKVRPKAVVVVNTLARKYLGKDHYKNQNVWLGFDFQFNKQNGAYYVANQANLKNVPFFFSGMLTGQRALDLGSFERLKWHLGKVLAGDLS